MGRNHQKVVPFLRDVCHVTLKRAGKGRQRIWEGIAQRGDVERMQNLMAGRLAAQ